MKTFEINGKEILVDDQDAYLLRGIKWYLLKARQLSEKYYAVTQMGGETVYLHRLIMGNPDGIVDHANRDTLDCRRENLRVTTQSINRLNCEVRKNKKGSQFKGVFKSSKKNATKPFYSQIRLGKKCFFVGSFETEQEAWQAYQLKVAELFPDLQKTG